MAEKLNYRDLRTRAERVRWQIWTRAQRLCVEAGCDNAGHLHNALVSLANGHPWREVDYSKARAAHRLFERQFIATRWLSNLYTARGPAAFHWD